MYAQNHDSPASDPVGLLRLVITPTPMMGKPTILCVDDEKLVLTSLRDMLMQVLGHDYVVEIAESGEEALEVIAELLKDQTEIPVIISDQLMPGLKGDELLAKVSVNSPRTRNVMLTGHATPEAIGNAVNTAKLFRYIAKPWSDTLLIGIVQEALNSYFQDKELSEVNTVLEKVNAELDGKIAERTAALQFRLSLERLLSKISTEFINIAPDALNTAIEQALKWLGEFVGVDRGYLFQVSEGQVYRKTHEWCSVGMGFEADTGQPITMATLPWAMAQLRQSKMVYIPHVEALPTEAYRERGEWQGQGIQSLLWIPIVLGGELFGWIGFDSVRQPKTWTDYDANALHLVGEIFASALRRRRAEAALRESEERFRQAFENAPIGLSLVALDGRLLRVNHSLTEIVGYSETELLGQTFQSITHADDVDADLPLAQQLLAGQIRCYQLEKRYWHKQGHNVWVSLQVSLVRDEQGEPLYFISQTQDVSDRHAIDQIKKEFISAVSHELRTPLTAIRGSLGLLDTGIFDHRPEQAKKMLKTAVNNSERLTRLVDDILQLERLESGQVELLREVCPVDDLMQQALNSVEAIALQSSITLQMTPLPLQVWVAPDAIIQTLTNLLSNAIKFSFAGGSVALAVTQVDLEPGGRSTRDSALVSAAAATPLPYLLFSIQDQGRGIPTDKLDMIFGRFQQVDVSDSRQKGGTGLGLAICKSIVQQHGGQIWAESVLGQGSTFYFTLPILVPVG